MSTEAPVAVWDCREDRWWDQHEARTGWLDEQGLLGRMIYRIEFRLIDAPVARIFCYALNAEGKRHWLPCHVPGPHDHSLCDVARLEPVNVLIDGLPPEELW
jgi:hypothetical protein